MFESLLFPRKESVTDFKSDMPACFKDLGLDLIAEGIAPYCGGPEVFYTPVREKSTVLYRQAVMKDMENLSVRRRFEKLSRRLKNQSREIHVQSRNLPYVECCDLISDADEYLTGLSEFLSDFPYREIRSEGLNDFTGYIRHSLNTEESVRMRLDLSSLRIKLQKIRFDLCLSGTEISVGMPEEGACLKDLAESLFGRFQQKNRGPESCQAPSGETDVRVENKILELVSGLCPDVFEEMFDFRRRYSHYADMKILRASSDIRFYTGYLNYTDTVASDGVPFCYPEIQDGPSGFRAENLYDLALAFHLSESGKKPVTNSIAVTKDERILVVTGPNQGGKTTFARSAGQLFFLASLGVRVPASEASLFLTDRIFTHFGKAGQHGADNLKEELLRLLDILDHATGRSLVLINEIFASVSHEDGLSLGRKMMEQLESTGCTAVLVTFLEELAVFGPHTVSLIGEVTPGKDERRSFRILRKNPDGNAHALSLAEKNGITYEQLIRSIRK